MSDDELAGLPDHVKPVAERFLRGVLQPYEALEPETRRWLARRCWNCRKTRDDCECLFA